MNRSFRSTIRSKLVVRTLLVVMFPLLVVGGVALVGLRQLTDTADESLVDARATLGDEVVGARAFGIADQVSREIALFVDERLHDAVGWARSSVVVEAAQAGIAQARAEGLVGMSIDEAEELYAQDRALGSRRAEAELQSFLDSSPDFDEVLFTESNGFIVAASAVPSEFVRSDEEWWQAAWADGFFVEEPGFDDSAGVFAVDIAIRIDAVDGTPLGVIKASLDIALVQDISDRFVVGDAGYDVTILERFGRFLARTENGHDPSGIMNSAVSATISANQRLIDAYSGNLQAHPDGYSIDDEAIAGYSHVSDHLDELRPESDTSGFQEAFDWIVVVEQPVAQGFAALAPLEQLSDDIGDASALMTLIIVGAAVAAIALAVVTAYLMSRRITRPIAALRDAAARAASETLPSVVARIDELDRDAELPSLEKVSIATGDEVEDLAESFNTVQQTAADLAAGQARLRRQNVASTFVSLGRRNQNLLSRQLEHINTMERTETDSEVLGRLFQLDHLATRMRRNAESLLVLAGEETPRRFRSPVTVRQLVQAAGGEIEEFDRIKIGSLDEASVEGSAASDMAHLLAELLENASRFSPPTAEIQIHGHDRADGGYTLSIVDQGIGMDSVDLVAANARLADPVQFDRAPSAYLGLFVVGHLAQRHGLIVSLADSPFGGVTAKVVIPEESLVRPERDPAPASSPRTVADQPGSSVAPVVPVTPDPDVDYRPEPVPAEAYEDVAHPDEALSEIGPSAEEISVETELPRVESQDEPPVAPRLPTGVSEEVVSAPRPPAADPGSLPVTETIEFLSEQDHSPIPDDDSPPPRWGRRRDRKADGPDPGSLWPAATQPLRHPSPPPVVARGTDAVRPLTHPDPSGHPGPPDPAGPRDPAGPPGQAERPEPSRSSEAAVERDAVVGPDGPPPPPPPLSSRPADRSDSGRPGVSPRSGGTLRRKSLFGPDSPPPPAPVADRSVAPPPPPPPSQPYADPLPGSVAPPPPPPPPAPVADRSATPPPPPPPPAPVVDGSETASPPTSDADRARSVPGRTEPGRWSTPPVRPDGETTPSGFRRRRRGREGAPTPVDPTVAPADEPRRDAESVQATLARFRAGVSQARAHVESDDTSGEPRPDAGGGS